MCKCACACIGLSHRRLEIEQYLFSRLVEFKFLLSFVFFLFLFRRLGQVQATKVHWLVYKNIVVYGIMLHAYQVTKFYVDLVLAYLTVRREHLFFVYVNICLVIEGL